MRKAKKKNTNQWFLMLGNSKKVVNWFRFPLWLPRGNKWASCQSAQLISRGPRLLINEMWEDKKTAASGATAYPQSLTAFSDWANHPIVPQHFESGKEGKKEREKKKELHIKLHFLFIYRAISPFPHIKPCTITSSFFFPITPHVSSI